MKELIDGIKKFYQGDSSAKEKISPTRDYFQARLDSFLKQIIKSGFSENDASLIVATVGEIGNNCFDHNLGQWGNIVGAYFDFKIVAKEVIVVIADNGTGLFKSLKRVKPSIQNDSDALKVAFEERISGRAPEKRGNGLKFVRSVINGSPNKFLACFSGKAKMLLGGNKKYSDISLPETQGVCTIVAWENL